MSDETDLEKMITKTLFFITEEQRRRTYKKWIYSDKERCNAKKMAEAGFIFIGDKSAPDAVKCFLCDKALDGWDSTDDPWSEHAKHSPSCFFAKLKKSEEFLTLLQFLDIKQKLVDKAIDKFYDMQMEHAEERLNDLEKQLEKKGYVK